MKHFTNKEIFDDPTFLRNRAVGQIEKNYHIDRMRTIRKNWAATDPFGIDSTVINRIHEIDFKLKLMSETPPEDFFDLDALTKKFNDAWKKDEKNVAVHQKN